MVVESWSILYSIKHQTRDAKKKKKKKKKHMASDHSAVFITLMSFSVRIWNFII